MIQDIYPRKLDNSFKDYKPQDDDLLLFFDEACRALVKVSDRHIHYVHVSENRLLNMVYLFSIDDTRFFLALDDKTCQKDGFSYYSPKELRDMCDEEDMLALFTAYHLARWYRDNRFCGRCGAKLELDKKERALRCPECGNLVFPRINPAVIVGVINGDKILITKYKRGFAHNALVAGFTEIGETLEETVSREVMEETGLKVKNIRYYKSQPWGSAQDVLMGYYCDVDGDTTIKRDDIELKSAEWVKREDIVLQPDNLSLTNEMMMMFKENKR